MKTIVLLLSVNWRAAIVKCFVETFRADSRNVSRVITIDSDRLAAGTYFSDKHYVVPEYVSKKYWPQFDRIIIEDGVNVIIPNTNRDCLYFAGLQKDLRSRGVHMLVADEDVVSIVCDKLLLYELLRGKKVLMPDTLFGEDVYKRGAFPVVVKPRKDSGSNQVFVADNQDELQVFLNKVNLPIVQSFINGIEYTVDIMSDFNCRIIGMVPRKRISVKSGTAVKTKTCWHPKLLDLVRELWDYIPMRGLSCMQFIENDQGIYFIEANPRLGSGVLASVEAGLNIPEWVRRINSGDSFTMPDNFYETNLTMLYYHEPIFLRSGEIHG